MSDSAKHPLQVSRSLAMPRLDAKKLGSSEEPHRTLRSLLTLRYLTYQFKWTLWFDNPTTKQTLSKFGQTLRSVYSFDTVEDFWALYNNIRTPGQLQPTATFYLFKDHIEPKWEDPENTHGGCWTCSVAAKGPGAKNQLDAWWLNGVLACIGEQFTEGGEICGIAVNIRPKGDRVELWTKTASNEAVQTLVGKQLKQFLDMPDQMKIGYSVFSEKLGQGSKARDRYSV